MAAKTRSEARLLGQLGKRKELYSIPARPARRAGWPTVDAGGLDRKYEQPVEFAVFLNNRLPELFLVLSQIVALMFDCRIQLLYLQYLLNWGDDKALI